MQKCKWCKDTKRILLLDNYVDCECVLQTTNHTETPKKYFDFGNFKCENTDGTNKINTNKNALPLILAAGALILLTHNKKTKQDETLEKYKNEKKEKQDLVKKISYLEKELNCLKQSLIATNTILAYKTKNITLK